MRRAIIHIFGKVHGVFFRQNTLNKANQLGLKGYVKNLDDGSVEIIAEGSEEQIDELVGFFRSNPGEAEVENLVIRYELYKSEFDKFEIK